MTRHVIIIGGGPAGIEAAQSAVSAGAKVTLISEGPLGGRAGWDSLLPSKVWLTAADTVGLARESALLGVAGTGEGRVNPAAILARIQTVAHRLSVQQSTALNSLGVEVLNGLASFEGVNRVSVKNEAGKVLAQLVADAVIIATGSVPVFPPGLRPDGKRILAPRFMSHLDKLPEDIIVIGAGATGAEFVYLFNQLGVSVTWIVDPYGVLPTFAPDAGQLLAQTLARRGVTIAANELAERLEADDQGVTLITTSGRRYRAALAFVAIGRIPDLSRLNLSAAGLTVEPRQAPSTDAFGRTAVAGIYAIGDAAGAPLLANKATAQAWVAGRHAAGQDTPPFRPETIIQAIYTEPQVAQVGLMAGPDIHTTRLPLTASLKTHLLPEGEGFVELAYTTGGRLTGGIAVGPHAAEILAPVALAIGQAAFLADLALIHGAYPTMSELAFLAARWSGVDAK